MELLSRTLIPQALAVIGAAMLTCLFADKVRYKSFNHTCLLVALWLCADIAIDFASTGLNEYWTASDAVIYFYLFAITSVLFLYQSSNQDVYPKSINFMFMAIAAICVAMGMYKWFSQSRWVDGGAEFYYSYGIMLDSAFVFSILAMDSLMIILGVYSALATNNNSNNSICGKQR